MTEPDFSPRLDGVEQAIRVGRRRRTHRHLSSAGAVAAVAVVAMLVAAGPFPTDAGRDSLNVAGDPTATGEPSPDPSGSATPSSEPSAQPSTSPDAGNRGGGPQPVGGGGYGNQYADPSASPDDSQSPEPPSRISPPPVRTVVAYSAGTDCATTPTVPVGSSDTWCVRYSGSTTVVRGGTATIAADLCRVASAGDGVVTFSDEDGMALDVSNSADTMWSSQDGRKIAKADEKVTVQGGTCLRWTTTWDTRDRDGFRVRTGDYYVGFNLTADVAWSGSYGSLTVTS